MPLFIWTEALATGSAFIDDEHHTLVKKVNAVLEAIAQGSSNPGLQRTLDELMAYTREHFGVEEAQMLRIHYAGLESHRADHGRLLGELQAFQSQLASGTAMDAMKAYEFITRWVKRHIVQFDKELAQALIPSVG